MQYQGGKPKRKKTTLVAVTIVTCACSLGNKVKHRREDLIIATKEGQDEHTLHVRGAAADTVLFFFLLFFFCLFVC